MMTIHMPSLSSCLSLTMAVALGLAGCDSNDDTDDGADSNDTDVDTSDGDGADTTETDTNDETGDTDDGGTATDDGTSTDDTGDSTAGTVEGTVAYDGTESGTLIVGLFADNPPAGPPAVFPPFTQAAPMFPVQYTMPDVPPGVYYVIALLDFPVEGTDAGNNVPDDGEPYAASTEAVVVEAGGSYEVDLTLTIP